MEYWSITAKDQKRIILQEKIMLESSDKTRYLTPNEAAVRLMISPVTLRHWALAGKLAFVTTPGGHRRFAEEEVERFAAEHQQTMAKAIPDDDGKKRILIVDDDIQLSEYLAELLRGLPVAVQIEVANDDFEVGQKILSFRPQVVLLDLMMPGLNGFGVCHKIKDNPATRNIRVIVMSSYITPENTQKAMQAGAEVCLAKPLDTAQLFNTILLDRSAAMGVRT